MFRRFKFEAEFYPNLVRVPVHVRMKLDLTGVKISLEDWLSFTYEERNVLCHLPADTQEEQQVFISYVDYLSRSYRGRHVARTAPLARAVWDTPDAVPGPVAERSAVARQPLTAAEWIRCQPVERYALYKTALSKNDSGTFLTLLNELREPHN
jgi:hypothetical protein